MFDVLLIKRGLLWLQNRVVFGAKVLVNEKIPDSKIRHFLFSI